MLAALHRLLLPSAGPRRRIVACVFCALAAVLLALGAQAQGYAKEKRPELGLVFERAKTYEEIPIPPTEEHIVLSFAEKPPADPKIKRAIRPLLQFVLVEKAPPRKASSGGGAPAGPAEGGSAQPEEGEDNGSPIDSIERWVVKNPDWRGWTLGQPIEGKERAGYKVREYSLFKKTPGGATAWMLVYDNGKRSLSILGKCHEADLKEQAKIWRNMAESVDISEPEEKSAEKLKTFYARKGLKAVDFRIKVRMDLVRGWKAEDTENFIVIYDTPDKKLVDKICRDLETLRKEYVKLFPPSNPVETVSAVRVCKSKQEYHSYGGRENTAGYWNAADEELVLYDAVNVEQKGGQKADVDTFIALYHEAFHQYIYYSTGELPPHSWFDEGHGDYFSGAQIKDGKLKQIGVMPWRIDLIKETIALERDIDWEKILRFEQPAYYERDIVHICYAQGWSMVYFLRKSEVVAKRPEWAKILPTYFDTLKANYQAKTAGMDAEDRGARGKAGYEARNEALEAAFKDVDLAEITKAWEGFILGLPGREKD